MALADADIASSPRIADARSVAPRSRVPSGDEPETGASGSAIGPAVYLQVGAFGDPDNAEQLRRQLHDRLAEPILVREPHEDRVAARFYKVHVGPIDSRARAATLGRELAALGISSSMVVNQ